MCFTNGPGSVTSLLMLDAARVVRHVWIVSDIDAEGTEGLPVQDVIVRTAKPSRGEKRR